LRRAIIKQKRTLRIIPGAFNRHNGHSRSTDLLVEV
jgi:hypothetical protein